MSATELLKSSFLQDDDLISVSLVKNMSQDGQQPVSCMLRKGEFLLTGNVDVASHVDLWLRFPDPSGNHIVWNLSFPEFNNTFCTEHQLPFRLFQECWIPIQFDWRYKSFCGCGNGWAIWTDTRQQTDHRAVDRCILGHPDSWMDTVCRHPSGGFWGCKRLDNWEALTESDSASPTAATN